MSAQAQEPGSDKEVLRVALNKKAAQDYAAMVEKIKAANPCVKIHPSQFASFIISDFFATYFEKDIGILVAEFFDSQSYYEAEAQRAKASGNFEAIMDTALAKVKRIKSKTRRKTVRKGKQKHFTSVNTTNEKV